MQAWIDSFKLDNTLRFLTSIVLIIVAIYLYKLITLLLHHLITDVILYYKVKTIVGYFIVLPLLIFIFFLWANSMGDMTTYFGLLSAGIAIALKDIIINIASWVFIILRKPFNVGDRIQVGEVSGDVIDQRMFHFTLMEIKNWVDGDQSTGRIIHVPNYKVFSDSMANYSKGFYYIWNEINVHLTLDSDWQKAKDILLKILNSHAEHLSKEAESKVRDASRKYMIYYTKLTPTVYTTVKDQNIQLSLRYLCQPKNRRNSNHEIWEHILIAFKEEKDIIIK